MYAAASKFSSAPPYIIQTEGEKNKLNANFPQQTDMIF